MSIIGIDLGTTNSLVSVFKDGKSQLIPNSFGEFLTPSVVSIDDDSVIVGKIAKERLVTHPNLTASSFKCLMGSDTVITIGDKEYRPYDLSSFILRQLKNDAEAFLGEPVEEAVISVPAYFDDNGRSATKLAGELAGLKVDRIINEPSAAALAYRMDNDKDEAYLIFDFGGGTLDISVVDVFDNVIEIIAVSGDNHLGGDDFNNAIAEYFCEVNELDPNYLPTGVWQTLIKQSELCKIALSTQEKAAIAINIADNTYSLVLDNKTLLKISAGIFKRIEGPIEKAIHDSRMSFSEISEIILVGGSSNMLLVQKYIESKFNKKVSLQISPDKTVAIGAGIAAGIKERNEVIKDIVLTDICPFSLGIAVYNRTSSSYGRSKFSPIIERNSTLPFSATHSYSTVADNLTSLNVRVAQGESLYFDDNLYLGELDVTIPSAPAGKECIEVTFTYDINGILQIDVLVPSTGEKISKVILNKNNSLTKAEIDKKLKEFEKIKFSPREKDENAFLISRAERLFAESFSYERERISYLLDDFILSLDTSKNRDVRIAREKLESHLDKVEFGSYED